MGTFYHSARACPKAGTSHGKNWAKSKQNICFEQIFQNEHCILFLESKFHSVSKYQFEAKKLDFNISCQEITTCSLELTFFPMKNIGYDLCIFWRENVPTWKTSTRILLRWVENTNKPEFYDVHGLQTELWVLYDFNFLEGCNFIFFNPEPYQKRTKTRERDKADCFLKMTGTTASCSRLGLFKLTAEDPDSTLPS